MELVSTKPDLPSSFVEYQVACFMVGLYYICDFKVWPRVYVQFSLGFVEVLQIEKYYYVSNFRAY